MCVLLLIIVIGSLAGLLLITLLDLTRFPPRYSNFGQSLLRHNRPYISWKMYPMLVCILRSCFKGGQIREGPLPPVAHTHKSLSRDNSRGDACGG